jgi:hypothetical protein
MIVERYQDDDGRVEVDAGDPSLDVLDPSYDPRGVHVFVIVQNASDQPVWDVTTHIPGFVPKKDGNNELEPTDFEDERVVIGPRETIRIPVEGYTLSYNRLPIEIESGTTPAESGGVMTVVGFTLAADHRHHGRGWMSWLLKRRRTTRSHRTLTEHKLPRSTVIACSAAPTWRRQPLILADPA